MSRFIDLLHQVKSILPPRNGGTGNKYGWGTAVVLTLVNASETNPLPLGTVVKLTGSQIVGPETAADSEDVIGVVVGYIDQNTHLLVEDECPVSGIAAVMIRGVCKVLIAQDVDRLDYVFSHATDGKAYGDPTLGTGAFGRFLTDGDQSDIDLIPAIIGMIGGGGGTGGASFTDGSVEFTFNLPTSGLEIYTQVPYNGTITAATMTADASGSAVVDLWLRAYASYPPTVSQTITASAKPTLSSAIKSQDSTLTGWTTAITKGQWMVAHVDSVSGIQRLTLALTITRSS